MIISNIKLPVTSGVEELKRIVAKKSGVSLSEKHYFRILKKSLDARDKGDIKYVYSVEISREEFLDDAFTLPQCDVKKKILVVGFGPAGMFGALYLTRAGFDVTVIERGKNVDERKKSTDTFARFGLLDTESNIQFGEGGAGAFSDGKLNTGVSSPLIKTVLKELVLHGAPKEIEYIAKPHIGSDRLPTTVKNIRLEIERLGGKVLFGKKLEKLEIKYGKVTSVIISGEREEFDDVILAIGHSARDTFYELAAEGVAMERKAFAMGFRIEHKRSEIDEAQYGKKYAGILPAADYRLASHASSRGVFTFCMCPGGYVMPSASEEEGVVTNGMSLYARDGENSNSAVLCEIYPSDFYDGVLGGVELQRQVERAAFTLGGGDYSAPVQKLSDFFNDTPTRNLGNVRPTYERFNRTQLGGIYPKPVIDAIKTGVKDMDRRLRGFACGDAILTAPETRSSSPVRVLRGERFNSVSAENLYPCGEGCGYAGGIMSAATDGIKIASAIAEKYRNEN